MMDSQETNLPKEENTMMDEVGKLEESQAMEVIPVIESETNIKLESVAEEEPEEQQSITIESDSAEEPEIQQVSENTDTEQKNIESQVEAEPVVDEQPVEEEPVVDEPQVEEEPVVDEPQVDAEPVVDEQQVEAIPEAETESEDVDNEAEAKYESALPVVETEPESIESEAEDETGDFEEELTESGEEDDIIEPLDAAVLAVITKSEIIERLQQIVTEPKRYVRNEVDILKQAFYKLRRVETEAEKKEFLEKGGEEKDFIALEDESELQMKSLISEYKEKRASDAAEEERFKEANLVLKQHLIERLKVLTESQDDFNKRYNEFRDIQRKWKEIRLIPQEYAKELWRNYQLYNERFYDIVKINNQFRDYDFKKNLDMKTALCETVERLANEETEVISAFHQLQKLHQQWREIGPVAKEFRESIWERFKEASTVINKKHQSHFEGLKEQEEKNLEEKTAICEVIETINFETLKTMRDWEKKTDEVIALQSKWRTIGFATKRQNVKIFERFRAACDNYFNNKSEFYKSIKQEMDKNLELKKALVEKAESMKDSTDWKETAKAFVEIQNEWKKIGPVARKYSETIWKQFIAACDYFFEKKNKEVSSQKSEEVENLEAKRALIGKINTIDESLSDDEALAELRGYIAEWNNIGFVPFKEKDKLYKSFREASDKQFDRLKINERDRRVQQFRSNITELAGGGKNKLYNERDKLMRIYERMKGELQTYENNIGFFNISSKGGDGLMKEMSRKIARLKEEMEVIVKKIEAIDENLD